MKHKKKIILSSILFGVIVIMLLLNLFYVPYIFEKISNDYQTDKEVIKVYETCLNSEIKAICVYENIDFVWEKAPRTIKNTFLSPTKMVEQDGHGLCRDIVVFRKAVFDKLEVFSQFVFEEKHVYINVFEGGKIYELDNGYIGVKNGTT